jgi:hypothetical protein
MPTLSKFLQSTVKKLQFLQCKTGLPDWHKFAAWRRQICFHIEVLYSSCSSSIYYDGKVFRIISLFV